MLRLLLISASVLLAAVVIRRTGVLTKVKDSVFDKVNDLIGFVGESKKENVDTTSSVANPTYH